MFPPQITVKSSKYFWKLFINGRRNDRGVSSKIKKMDRGPRKEKKTLSHQNNNNIEIKFN